jgi:hypothetical protein
MFHRSIKLIIDVKSLLYNKTSMIFFKDIDANIRHRQNFLSVANALAYYKKF